MLNNRKAFQYGDKGLIASYYSIAMASSATGISSTRIQAGVAGRALMVGGFYWSEREDDSVEKIINRFVNHSKSTVF